jgi:hypothetical protein
MIDWYVILFVAITLIIFHMKEFGEHPEPARYIQDRTTIPVSAGAMQLLFRLMTGSYLFIPFYFTISYGYLSGFSLALGGVIVLVSFSSLAGKLSSKIPSTEYKQSFLEARFSKKGLYAFYCLMMIAAAEGLIVSTLLAVEFFRRVFAFSPYMTAIPLLAFSFIFAGMGGIRGVRIIGTWLIMIFFTGITILPLSAFLINGAKPIYTALYANHSINHDAWGLLIGVFLFMPVLAGHLLSYFISSNDLISIKSSRVKIAVGLGSISWSAIPLALSSIVIYLFAITSSRSATGLLAGLHENMHVLPVYVLVFAALSSFVIGIGLSLYTMTSFLFTLFPGKIAIQKGYLFSLILCLIPLVLINESPVTLKNSVIFFANFYAALWFPLWLTLKGKVRWGIAFTVAILISAGFGTWISLLQNWKAGIPVTIAISLVIITGLFIRNIRKVQK